MDWILYAWAVMGGTCLTIAMAHVVVWLRDRTERSYLLFSICALAIASISVFELMLMTTESPREYASLYRWAQVPVFVLITSVVAFLRVHFNAGRRGLAYLVVGASALVLVAGIWLDLGIRFAEVPTLERFDVFGGALVTVGYGSTTGWQSLATFRLLIYLAYIADASLTLWRRGDYTARRRVVLVGGGLMLSTLIAAVHGALNSSGVIRSPTIVTPASIVFLIMMGYELSDKLFDAKRFAGQLASSRIQLQQSVQRLELAAEAAKLGFWEWKVGSRVVWMNERCRGLLGFSSAEPSDARRILRRIHPADRRQTKQDIAGSLRAAAQLHMEVRVRPPGGGTQWLQVHGQAATDDKGKLVLLRGVARDVTRQAEAELQLRQIVESGPYAILVVDRAGRIALATNRSTEMFGYAHDEILRGSIGDLVRDSLGRGLDVGLLPTDASGYVEAAHLGTGSDLYGVRTGGIEFPVEIWISFIEAPQGARAMIAVLDITERRKAEAEAEARRNELVHVSRVGVLGELSGALAHELNQPLAAILSNAQAAQRFLERDASNVDEVREILIDIVDADRRAGAIIDRMRALLKKETTSRQRTDMNDIVLDMLHLMHSELLNRHVVVRTDLAPTLPVVEVDRIQMQQILLNLLTNACDAMSDLPRSDRVVSVATSLCGDAVEISVTDQGPGVPPEDLGSIFEPFKTTKAHGMGVGLSVCRAIVRAHGGSIDAYNGASRGATFRFLVPVASRPTD